MRSHYNFDWGFAAQGAVRSVVEEQLPHELHRWPLLRTFSLETYNWRDEQLILVLRDKQSGAIYGGHIDPADWPDAPDEPPSDETIGTWQQHVRERLQVKPRDMVVIIPIGDGGTSVETDWEHWTEEERSLWHTQIALNLEIQHQYLQSLTKRAYEDAAALGVVPASDQSWDSLYKWYEERVVHLEVRRDGVVRGASAFVVGPGLLATAAHNFDEGTVSLGASKVESVRRHAAAADGVDVATFELAIVGDSKDEISFASTLPTPGEEIAVLGYPSIPKCQSSLAILTGRVESVALDYSGEHTFIQVSVPVAGGMSGGPVINRRGEVLGVLSGRSYEKTASDVPGRAFTQVVPASCLRGLLTEA